MGLILLLFLTLTTVYSMTPEEFGNLKEIREILADTAGYKFDNIKETIRNGMTTREAEETKTGYHFIMRTRNSSDNIAPQVQPAQPQDVEIPLAQAPEEEVTKVGFGKNVEEAEGHLTKLAVLKPITGRDEIYEGWVQLNIRAQLLQYVGPNEAKPHFENLEGRYAFIFLEHDFLPEAVQRFRFVVCEQESSKGAKSKLIIMGFGHPASSLQMAQRSLIAYLEHPNAFGTFVPFTSFHSGMEFRARLFFRTKEETINEKIALIKGIPEDYSTAILQYAWSVLPPKWMTDTAHNDKETMMYLGAYIWQSDPNKYAGSIESHFFVAFMESKENIKDNIVVFVGESFKDRGTMLVSMNEYLRPTHITDHIAEGTINLNTQTYQVHPELKVVVAANLAARKVSNYDRPSTLTVTGGIGEIGAKFNNRTPQINFALDAADIAVEGFDVTNANALSNIFLSSVKINRNVRDIQGFKKKCGLTYNEDLLTIEDMIDLHGSEQPANEGGPGSFNSAPESQPNAVAATPATNNSSNTATSPITGPSSSHPPLPKPRTEKDIDDEYFKSLVRKKTLVIEGTRPSNLIMDALLHKLQAEMTKKKLNDKEPWFKVVFRKSFRLDGYKRYGIYMLTEKPSRTSFFTVEDDLTNEFSSEPAVIGELLEGDDTGPNVNLIQYMIHQSYTEAKRYANVHNKEPVNRRVELVIRAMAFMGKKHFAVHQRRKDDNATPYINHLLGVAVLLIEAGITEFDLILAALFHDSLENTDVTKEWLAVEYSKNVADIVFQVTDDIRSSTGLVTSAAERKAEQVAAIAGMRVESCLLKMADTIYNMSDQTYQCPKVFGEAKRQNNLQVVLPDRLEAFKKNREGKNKHIWDKSEVYKNAYKKMEKTLRDIYAHFLLYLDPTEKLTT